MADSQVQVPQEGMTSRRHYFPPAPPVPLMQDYGTVAAWAADMLAFGRAKAAWCTGFQTWAITLGELTNLNDCYRSVTIDGQDFPGFLLEIAYPNTPKDSMY